MVKTFSSQGKEIVAGAEAAQEESKKRKFLFKRLLDGFLRSKSKKQRGKKRREGKESA